MSYAKYFTPKDTRAADKNPFLSYATTQKRLITGQRLKVLNFDRDTGDTWQAWIFSNEVSDKSTWVEFVVRGSFGTVGNIETRIGGGSVGGDVITGTGPCEVFATGEGNNLISVWFTPEQSSIQLPPKAQYFDLAVIGSTQTLGYPPFSRYNVSIKSTNIFTLVFEDDNGNNVYDQNIDPATQSVLMNRIYHHPDTVLKITSTVVNQRFVITHYK